MIIADLNLLPPEKTPYFIGLAKYEYLFLLKNFFKELFVSLATSDSFFENFVIKCFYFSYLMISYNL